MDNEERPYVLDTDEEPLRLEFQAKLAGLEEHFQYFDFAHNANILDAGCGSGSMTRLMAKRAPDGRVTGLDTNEHYFDFARRAAEHEGLQNVEFVPGDVLNIPFPNHSFDLVWSKYVLQHLKNPMLAVHEFKRVTRPGGLVVCCNFDGYNVWNCPEIQPLQQEIERNTMHFVDPYIGRKMYSMFYEAGYADIRVDFEPDRVFNVIGQIDAERRENWEIQAEAIIPHLAQIYGTPEAARKHIDEFLTYQEREDTCSFCNLFLFRVG